MSAERDLPIVNDQDGGADWAPMEFVGETADGRRRFIGMTKRCFGVAALEINGCCPLPLGGSEYPVNVFHLPTGYSVCAARHGAHGMRIADALTHIAEFGRPFDEARLQDRGAEIMAILRREKAGKL